jgi:uncharacterized protein (TIGR02453 family)
MAFFSPSFLTFFKQLAKNNNTTWFNENRSVYEKEVKKPFAVFVEEMIKRISQHEPDVKIKPADAITRINKDIRFSKDKTPYNLHVAANISAYGKKDKAYPGFFFSLGPENIQIYGGVYMPDKAQLENIRKTIVSNPKEFEEAINDAAFISHFGHIRGETQKRLEPDLKAIVAKQPLIANKQFYYSAELEPENITKESLADTLMEYYNAARKVNRFLQKAF